MITKTKKASALVFALMIMAAMLVIAIGSFQASIINTRTSTDTEKSVSSLQSADSGVEVVIQMIKQHSGENLTQAGLCTGGDPVYSEEFSERKYEVEFLNDSNDVITDCATLTDSVRGLRSRGEYGGTIRAVEVEVVNDSCPETGWKKMDDLGNEKFSGVAMSNDGKKMFAAKFNLAGERIRASTDYGESWTENTSGPSKAWVGISSSEDGSKLLAITFNSTLYVSTNSGNTWTSKISNASWKDSDVSDDGKYMGAVVYNGDIYISNDFGETWKAKTIVDKFLSGIPISADGEKMIASTHDSATTGAVYVSLDYGETWILKLNDNLSSIFSVAISDDGGTMMALADDSGEVHFSTDNGQTWNKTSGHPSGTGRNSIVTSSDEEKIAIHVGMVSTNHEGYVYISNDGGDNWTEYDPAGSPEDWGHNSLAMSSDGRVILSGIQGSDDGVYRYCQ